MPLEPTLITPPADAVALIDRLALLMFSNPPLVMSDPLTVPPHTRSCVDELTPPPLMTSPIAVSPERT